jgi:hypothetical protein
LCLFKFSEGRRQEFDMVPDEQSEQWAIFRMLFACVGAGRFWLKYKVVT